MNLKMNLQYISDHKGAVTGVFIPIKEWDTIREQLHLPKDPKHLHKQELLEAFDEMRMMRSGKMSKPNLTDFLNELQGL